MAKKSSPQDKLINLQAQQLAAQVANWAAQLEFQKERLRLLELPEMQGKLQVDIDRLAFDKGQAAWENAFKQATLTGTYNGQPTIEWLTQQAQLTGVLDGKQTLQGKLTDAQIAQMNAQMKLANDEFVSNTTGYYNGQKTFDREKFEAGQAQDAWKFLATLTGPENAFKQARAIGSMPGGLSDLMNAWAGKYTLPGSTSAGSGGRASLAGLMGGDSGGGGNPGSPAAPVAPGAPGSPAAPVAPGAPVGGWTPPPSMVGGPGLKLMDPRQFVPPPGMPPYGPDNPIPTAPVDTPTPTPTPTPVDGGDGGGGGDPGTPVTIPNPAPVDGGGGDDGGGGGSPSDPVPVVYPPAPDGGGSGNPAAYRWSSNMAYTYQPAGVQANAGEWNYSANPNGGVSIYPPGVSSPAHTPDISSNQPMSPAAASSLYQYGGSATNTSDAGGGGNPGTVTTLPSRPYVDPLLNAGTGYSGPLLPNQIDARNYNNTYDYGKALAWAKFEDDGWDKQLAQDVYQKSLPKYTGPKAGSFAF